jgi:hypothetical protein
LASVIAELYDIFDAKTSEFKKKGLSEKKARKKAWKAVHKEMFGTSY